MFVLSRLAQQDILKVYETGKVTVTVIGYRVFFFNLGTFSQRLLYKWHPENI